jgi:hypothetical protein
MATVAYTYDDKANREDLLDLITNLDFKETQLFSGLGTSAANGVSHQWLKDTLKAPAANAKVEGADASSKTITNPTRLTNYCQIVDNTYQVSETERAVDSAGFADRKAYEATKAMKEWKQDVEFALMRGTLVCGNNSVARSMLGIKGWLSNVTANSGVSLTESKLNDMLQMVWDDGTEVNAIYAPMYLKRKISGFTASSTKNVDAMDRRLVNAVDIYQADAAQNVKLFAHRFVTVSGDTNYDLVGINEDMFKVAWLRKPKDIELAKTGDSVKSQLIGEGTLECYHENAGFKLQAIL